MMIDEFLTRFDHPKKNGSGYAVRCPAHSDQIASLSIKDGNDKILLKCHAGCSTESIVSALGLQMKDLFSKPLQQYDPNILYFKGALVSVIYEYRDQNKKLVYRVLRNEKKNFAQQRLENGEWIWKGPETKLLYRLPEVLADESDQPVFIPEGEKDVDNLRRIGLLATCNTGGAGKFTQDNSSLIGRKVVILPDNDEPGRKHAVDVLMKLKNVSGQVVILELKGVPEKGDVSNWLQKGGTKDELLKLVDDAFSSKEKTKIEHFLPSDTLLRPHELTVMGLAARFHDRYYRDTRYVEARSAFFNYENGVWRSSRCSTEAKTKHIINEVHDESVRIEKKVEELNRKQKAGDNSVLIELQELAPYLERLQKFAGQIKKPRTMDEIMSFSKSDLVIGSDEFDANPSIFNVANGTIDLDTGSFHEHKPEDLCSMQSLVVYDPNAICTRWLRFLREIFLEDKELIEFIKRVIGYSISGFTSEQIFLILHGDGSNGKSELLSVLGLLLGNYLKSANVDTFMEDKLTGGHNEDIARLRGARLVTTSETEKSRRLAEGLIKRLTGGDVVTASYKHERTFEFIPRFKVWLAANHKPNISGTDYGIWRRIMLVPFSAKFVKPGIELEENQFRIDPNLKSDLKMELSGVLNWTIEGYQEWRKEGLNPPQIVKAVTEEYRVESDKLGAFLSEEMTPNDKPASLNSAYQAYKSWAENGGMRSASIRGFASDLRSRGIEVRKYGLKNDVCVIGYALLAKE